MFRFFVFMVVSALVTGEPPAEQPASKALSDEAHTQTDSEEPPEGYYAFVESPNATPPRHRVRAGGGVPRARVCRQPVRGPQPRHNSAEPHGPEP
ncbi:unnamed protein product [Leptidea sinapis]|uniref:Secreted protein n=1 Tax=Leptidea sinapis TaxID=189913 RepID=A0A5E4R222_9NEOP|nr:unnamed protein product [Leptidea sinapis]